MPTTGTLLVDDSPAFLESITRFLAVDERIQIVGQALSGREAIEQATVLRPDLVLMDWSMPEMNGLEATRHLKAQPQAPHVVIVTLHDTPEYRSAAQDAGADGFITKSELGAQLLPLIDTFHAAKFSQGQ